MDACVRIPALADSLPSPCCLAVGLESADELAHTREAEQAWPCCPGSILGRPTSLTRRLDDQGVPFRTITAIFASVWVLSELQGTEVDKKDPAGYEITEKSNNKSSEVWQGYQHAAAVAAEG